MSWFKKIVDSKLVLGALLFFLASIAADGLTTYLGVDLLGGQESNPYMRDWLGGMVWPNFFKIQGIVVAFFASYGILLYRLTKNEQLTAIYYLFLSMGSLHAAVSNLVASAARSGWFM